MAVATTSAKQWIYERYEPSTATMSYTTDVDTGRSHYCKALEVDVTLIYLDLYTR
jgi:hypothetical protein